ncbi:MAG: DUF4765 family protein [Bryobacteraceae bacterium]
MATQAPVLSDAARKLEYKGAQRPQLQPWSEAQVEAAAPDTLVILWRGTTYSRLNKMVQMNSLSGEASPNPDAVPPEQASVNSQVGTNVPGQVRIKLPEFTTAAHVAAGYGRGGVILIAAIKKKYLAKASGSEGGWAASNDAPFEHLLWVPGEPLAPGTSGKRLNAD